jgi:GntR family transcriptional regulator / MocR family aminotransferase
MPRKPLALPRLNRQSRVPLQDQLAIQLKQAIQSGTLKAGESLPSSRDLASELGVSRNTAIAACDRLLGEGYVESEPRSGIRVSREFKPAEFRPALAKFPPHAIARKPAFSTRLDGPRPFRPCQPDVKLFPLALWNRLRNQATRRLGEGLLHYQSRHALGLPVLRRELAGYLGASRGVRCEWEQIAITTGSQQALYLLSQLLLKPGARVFQEDPGYPGARRAFQSSGARLKGLAVDIEGAIPSPHPRPAALVYCTPSRQFPTGATMPVARRMALLEFARRCNAWLVEDDYDSEFRYAGPPLPCLQSLDPAGRVIHIGSMSKTLIPSLRIGYVVLPKELVEPFELLRLVADDHGPLIDQAALAAFVSTGGFYSHIRRCRKSYAAKLACFLEATKTHDLPLDFPFPDGGMNQTGYFREPVGSVTSLALELEREGLDVPTTASYLINARRKIRPALVFGFSAFDPAEIRRGIALTARAIQAVRAKTPVR